MYRSDDNIVKEDESKIIQTLVKMGFDESNAKQAIGSTCTFEEALNKLLVNDESSKESKQISSSTEYVKAHEPFIPGRIDTRDEIRLKNIASNDLESSENLKKALERRDSLSNEIRKQRDIVKSFMKHPYSVDEDSLEELYLFLKEMIHKNADLSQHKDQIHKFVFSKIRSSHSTLVPCLIELLDLENEDFHLIRMIHKILDQPLERKSNDINPNSRKMDSDILSKKLCTAYRVNKKEVAKIKELLEEDYDNEKIEISQEGCNQKKHKKQELLISIYEERKGKKENTKISRCKENIKLRNEAILSGVKIKHDMMIEQITKKNTGANCLNKKIASKIIDAHFDDVEKLQQSLHAEKVRQLQSLKERLQKRKKNAKEKANEGSQYINERCRLEQQSGCQEQAITNEKMKWLMGTLIGSNADFRDNDILNNSGFSYTALRLILDKYYPIYLSNILRLEKDLHSEKVDKKRKLFEELYSYRESNILNVPQNYEDILQYFDEEFNLHKESLLRLALEKIQNQLSFVCKNVRNVEHVFVDNSRDEFHSLLIHLCENHASVMKKNRNEKKLHAKPNDNNASFYKIVDKYIVCLFEQVLKERKDTKNHKDESTMLESMERKDDPRTKTSKVMNIKEIHIFNDHDTEELVRTLKQKRKKELNLLKLKWDDKNASENFSNANFILLRQKNFAEVDKTLTLKEYKIIDEFVREKKANSLYSLDIDSIIENVHADFAYERQYLHQTILHERNCQGSDPSIRRESISFENNLDNVYYQDFSDDLKKITAEHAREREAIEITLDLERARQKQALQQRLLERKTITH